jgi:chemosensory pili system protein ChpA (sensor histidine kinase/response regulator)
MMAEQFDISTLAWVKGEIDETLKQARIALERYVDEPDDEVALELCITLIHQVYGTLQMVELSGAALFAGEIEQFGSAIQKGQVQDKEQAYELLMRSILQLPDYLENLLDGQQDNPQGLVPLLNEMREQRRESLLDSAAFFRPNLTVSPPPRAATPPAGIDSSVVAKKLHRFYMAALVKIIKGVETKENLKILGMVLDKLLGVAETEQWRRLLWVSAAFVESLMAGSIGVTRESKPLLGKLEQQLKAVAAKDEGALSEETVPALLLQMLYLLAHAPDAGPISAEVSRTFELQRFLPLESGRLGGINAELKQTVSADIMEELSSVKDAFDVFVRSDRTSVASLEPMAGSLGRMVETLSLLQEDALRENLRQQVEVIHQLLSGELAVTDDTLMGIAGAILAVESALRDWGSEGPLVKADASEEQIADADKSPQAAAEHLRVTRQVMKEARDDLVRIREAINNYLENPEDKSVLDNLPSVLHMIIGSLTLLSYKRVAQVLVSCRAFIEKELLNADTIPGNEKLDALADAIMSVEYYLEAFVQSRVHPGSVLDVAESAVTLLGYDMSSLASGMEEEELSSPEIDGFEVFESQVAAPEVDNQDEDSLSGGNEFESTLHSEQVIADIDDNENSVEQDALPPGGAIASGVHESVVSQAEPAVQHSVRTPSSTATVEVDDEILEIFIEEAEEELQNLRSLFPKWTAAPAETEVLKDVRRSFHTLKGSGRLVGATELGEFAWAFENMLNRVLDGTITHNTAIFDIVTQAIDVLPEMIEQFRSGVQPQSDVALLQEMANDIAQGTAVPPPRPSESKKPASEEQKALAAEKPAPVPELDPVLLEIYSKEAVGHLEELEQFIRQLKAGGSRRVSEPVIRALHTLQGSSRMAGISSVADVCAKLEKYAKTLQASNENVDDDGVEALEQCVSYVQAMLLCLAEPDGNLLPDNSHALELAGNVFARVQHLEHMAHAQPEAGLAQTDADEEEGRTGAVTDPVSDAHAAEMSAGNAEVADDVVSEGLEAIEPVWTSIPDTLQEQVEPVLAEIDEPVVAASPYAIGQHETVGEDYDPELLEIFLEEGADILDASEETLQAWVDNPADRSLVEALQRQLHTLKGGARMAGIKAVGDLSHSLESTVEKVVEGLLDRSPAMMDLLQLSHDRLVTMLEQVRNHEPVSQGDDLIRLVEDLSHSNNGTAVDEREANPVGNTIDSESAAVATPPVVSPLMDNAGMKVVTMPEIEPDLSALEEAVADVEFCLSNWVRDVNDRELFENLRRSGIKLARVSTEFGITEIVSLTDALADLLSSMNDGHIPASKKNSDMMMFALDRIRLMMTQVKTLEPLDNNAFLVSNIREIIVIATADASKGEKVVDLGKVREGIDKSDAEEDNRRSAPRIQHELVRVRADLLDNLVNFAGEVSIYRSRVEQQIGSFRSSIEEMDQTVVRLRDQVRQFDIETESQIESRKEEAEKMGYEEFDPLEFDRFTHMQQLSRSMVESLSDLVSIEDILLNLTRESETLLLQQARVNTELQESLMHTRMVPLVEHAPRLRRIVRQTSAELGKRTNLSFRGADVEMDRNVVERMMAPLEHMLRNSIAHGIEDIETRLAAGKTETGNIVIALSREGSEIVVRVSDDGAGIDLAAVKKKAIERGLMKEGAKLSDKEIMGFILESGFSTAQSVSQISGRGVGMDVVNSEIKQLGGILDIESSRGKGTVLTVRLPLTLSVSRALLVNVAEDIYAIPLLSISGIERISATELEAILNSENPVYNWVGEEYDVLHLTALLKAGSEIHTTETANHALLLTKSGEQRIAFAIEGLIGSREIVVKSLGPQLSTLQDLAGATILADGRVALIIDMPSLIRRGMARKSGKEAALDTVVEMPVVQREPTVMVVDDSITVRKVTERLLKRHNMKCITAKDGVDALTVLEETIPDVMLLDIEMPRMDGFELATHIRNSERLKGIPIIMITSRTGDKHRQRAMDIGVNKYMGKPYTEVDLLDNIETLIANHTR